VFTFLPNYPAGKIHPHYRGRWIVVEQDGAVPVYRYPLFADHSANLWRRALGMVSMSLSIGLAYPALRRFRPDVLLVQSPPLLLATSGWALAGAVQAKLVLNLSDLWPSALADLGALSRQSWSYRLLHQLEKFLYQKAGLVIGQSGEILQYLAVHAPAVPSLLYRNGVDLASFAVMATVPSHKTPIKIVYTGLFGLAQGILSLCQRVDFQALGAELHLYGDGAERQQLADLIAAQPTRGIFLHQPIPMAQIPGLLTQFDAALVAQKSHVYGTVPSKLYEAMAAGLPVIYLGAGEGARLVRESGAGWVCAPGDAAALAQLMQNWPHEPAIIQQMSRNGRTAAALTFNRDVYLQELLVSLTKIIPK